ncbi:MAG: DNA polymerase III subunit delta [Tannerellaceae bacterium]|jgi:DNA polymerase-3 subunit delta|nr:DNA polymerase III subunit delta [Tannerellaceae bacterium]
MAKKELSFEEICKDVKAKKFVPVYLLMGEEPFFIDQITDLLLENVLNESEKDFNQTILYGAETDAGTIFNAARRFPMMSEYQLVVVREAQDVKNIDILANYAKNPLRSTVLVINYKYKPLDKRKALALNADKMGILFESKKIQDYKMPTFITDLLQKQGIGVDAKSAQMLADFLGNDLCRLNKEIEKLSLLLPETGVRRITPEMIEQNIGISKEYNNFELQRAISVKDILKANRIIKYFEKDPNFRPHATLTILFAYFSNLLICYYTTNRSDQGLAAALGFPYINDYKSGMRHFTAMKAFNLIGEIRLANARLNGVGNLSLTESYIMRELLYKILH